MLLTQEIRDGECFVQLHLDPERKVDPFSNLPNVRVLHGLPGAVPARATIPLQWKNADLLEAEIPIEGRETVLNTVEVPGQQPVTLPPLCLPYSPEFAPDQPGRGAAALTQIATTTGGKERVEIPKIWSDLPIKSRYVELAPWLLVIAAFLFLVEILDRRAGWISRWVGRRTAEATIKVKEQEPEQVRVVRKATAPVAAKTKATGPAPVTVAESKPAPEKVTGTESAIDALRKARERAHRRMDKDKH
jgi:hypothetical protein